MSGNYNGPEFFQTVMGQRFYEGTVPKIARSLERLTMALEEHNALDRKSDEREAERLALLQKQNDLNEQIISMRQKEMDLFEKQSQCDCPECVARREAEAEADAKG